MWLHVTISHIHILSTSTAALLASSSLLVHNSTRVVLFNNGSILRFISNLEYVTPSDWLVPRKTSDMVGPTSENVLLNANPSPSLYRLYIGLALSIRLSLTIIDLVGRGLALDRLHIIHKTELYSTSGILPSPSIHSLLLEVDRLFIGLASPKQLILTQYIEFYSKTTAVSYFGLTFCA